MSVGKTAGKKKGKAGFNMGDYDVVRKEDGNYQLVPKAKQKTGANLPHHVEIYGAGHSLPAGSGYAVTAEDLPPAGTARPPRSTKRRGYTETIEDSVRAHEAGFTIVQGTLPHGTITHGQPVAIVYPDYEEEESALAERLVNAVAAANPDISALCGTYKLKREELGRLTGFSLRALAEWANKKLPSEPARRRLREVRRLLDALAEIVKVESIPKWLHQPNPAFAPLTPLQVIELGEIDRLWAMVYQLGSGQLD